MDLSQSDKILLLSAGILTVSTIAFIKETKKYEKEIINLHNQLTAIYYLNSQINSNVLDGNTNIDEGNKIMRSIIRKSIEEEAGGYS